MDLFINYGSHALCQLELDGFYCCGAWRGSATSSTQFVFWPPRNLRLRLLLVQTSTTSLKSTPQISGVYRSFNQAPNKPANEGETSSEQCGPKTKPHPNNT